MANGVWPFHGTLSIELLNQLNDYNHHRMELILTGSGNTAVRPPQGGRKQVGCGWSTFFPHPDLEHPPTTTSTSRMIASTFESIKLN